MIPLVDERPYDDRPLGVGVLKVVFPVSRMKHAWMMRMLMWRPRVVWDVSDQRVSVEQHQEEVDLDCTRSDDDRDGIQDPVNELAGRDVGVDGIVLRPAATASVVKRSDEVISVDLQLVRKVSKKTRGDFG